MVRAATWIVNVVMLGMMIYLYVSYQPLMASDRVDPIAINIAVNEALMTK